LIKAIEGRDELEVRHLAGHVKYEAKRIRALLGITEGGNENENASVHGAIDSDGVHPGASDS